MSNFNYKEMINVLNDTVFKLEEHLISESDCLVGDEGHFDEALVLDDLQNAIERLKNYQVSLTQYVN